MKSGLSMKTFMIIFLISMIYFSLIGALSSKSGNIKILKKCSPSGNINSNSKKDNSNNLKNNSQEEVYDDNTESKESDTKDKKPIKVQVDIHPHNSKNNNYTQVEPLQIKTNQPVSSFYDKSTSKHVNIDLRPPVIKNVTDKNISESKSVVSNSNSNNQTKNKAENSNSNSENSKPHNLTNSEKNQTIVKNNPNENKESQNQLNKENDNHNDNEVKKSEVQNTHTQKNNNETQKNNIQNQKNNTEIKKNITETKNNSLQKDPQNTQENLLNFEPVEIVKEISEAGKAALQNSQENDVYLPLGKGFETPTFVSQIITQHPTQVKTPGLVSVPNLNLNSNSNSGDEPNLWQNVEYRKFGSNIMEAHEYITPAKFTIKEAEKNSSIPHVQATNFLDIEDKNSLGGGIDIYEEAEKLESVFDNFLSGPY